MLRKIKKFTKLSNRNKLIALEVFILSAIIRFAILFISFSKVAKLIGEVKKETSEEITDTEKLVAWNISRIVYGVCNNTPWESKCLVKALAAQIVLKQYKISSTLYLGVAKDETGKLIAHAWLRCGSEVVTGYNEKHKFTQVAMFANYARDEKL